VVRVSLVGIDLITVEARVVVASIDTYLRYAEAMGITAPVARRRRWQPVRANSWPPAMSWSNARSLRNAAGDRLAIG